MEVRIFALGNERLYPDNYQDVALNPARLNWSSGVANYKTAVTRAVDELDGSLSDDATDAVRTGSVQVNSAVRARHDSVPHI